MNKIFLFIFLMMVLALGYGCTNNVSNTITTVDATNVYDAHFPVYPDDDDFIYAELGLHFIYNVPSEGFPDRDTENVFYETNNQIKFDLLELTTKGHFDDYHLSSYSPLVILTYKTKKGLFDDFLLLQNAIESGYMQNPSIFLNTIGESYELTLDSEMSDLIEQTDKYFDTKIIYDSLPFEVIYTSQTDYEEDFFLEGSIINTYASYINTYPENDFDLTESYFNTYLLIKTGFGHSSSYQIGDIADVFYLEELTLEIAIEATAISSTINEDFIPYTMVIALEKVDFKTETNVMTHLHVTYLNGYLYDRPFHNIYDDNH